MTTITKGLLAAAVCLVVLVLAPAAVPTDAVRQALEARLSSEGQSVRIARLYFTILPRIQLVAEGVEGANGALRIDRASVVPVVASLWRDRVEVAHLHLQGVHAEAEALFALLRRSPSPGPSAVLVKAIRIDDASLVAGGAVFAGIDADIVLGVDGRPARVNASMHDRRVNLEVLPTATGALQLAFQATDWVPPVKHAIRLDELRATAVLELHRLEAWNVRAQIGRGSAIGFLSVRWNPEWVVTGEFSLRDIALERLDGEGSRGTTVAGILQATPRFVARARTPDKLLTRLELASAFVVRDAVVRKVDLQAAGRSSRGPSQRGEQTRFERVAGHVSLRRGQLDFTGLDARSGMLVARGNVTVAADRVLSGRIDARVDNSAGLLAIPLRVSGTLDDPNLAPTTGAAAGAALGSVVLPGLGTALGARAGQAAEDFFGALRARPRREVRPD